MLSPRASKLCGDVSPDRGGQNGSTRRAVTDSQAFVNHPDIGGSAFFITRKIGTRVFSPRPTCHLPAFAGLGAVGNLHIAHSVRA